MYGRGDAFDRKLLHSACANASSVAANSVAAKCGVCCLEWPAGFQERTSEQDLSWREAWLIVCGTRGSWELCNSYGGSVIQKRVGKGGK